MRCDAVCSAFTEILNHTIFIKSNKNIFFLINKLYTHFRIRFTGNIIVSFEVVRMQTCHFKGDFNFLLYEKIQNGLVRNKTAIRF